MPNRKETTTSDFYCVQCGNKGIPIARKVGSQREAGHLKKLYCPYCKEEVNHAEVRPFGSYNYEDFELEFKLGRFVDGLRIPVEELENCNMYDCNYCVNGKCWNANKSNRCIYRILEVWARER